MIVEKYGKNYNGLSTKKMTFRQVTNRLQNAVNYFLNTCDAERYYSLARMYRYLSVRDKKQFDNTIASMAAWLDMMAFDGMDKTKLKEVNENEENSLY